MTPDFASLSVSFNKAAKHARLTAFVDKILAERLDLKGQDVLVPLDGRMATTVVIGDEVFKMATDKRRLKEFARELDILEIMTARKVPFVPQLTHVSSDRSFFGMKKIAGVTLKNARDKMTDEEFMCFAESFGQARAAIDNALAGVQLPDSKRFNNRKTFNCTARALRLWNRPYLQATLAACDEETRALLTDYHDRSPMARRLFCLVDMNRGNILVDPVTKQVTGFVDMARVCQSPFPEPEFERLYLTIKASEGFVRKMYTAYATGAKDQGVAPTDMAAYEALHTFGFWHEGSDRKAPEIVKRGIENCIDALPRAKVWLP